MVITPEGFGMITAVAFHRTDQMRGVNLWYNKGG